MDKENVALRKLLWLRHGCDVAYLYGDDGEMQCNNCILDFKRDSVETIRKRWRTKAQVVLEEWIAVREATKEGGILHDD